MKLATLVPGGLPGSHLEFRFPLASGEIPLPEEPRALLSLRASGDMRYVASQPSSRREAAQRENRHSFLSSLGLDPARVLGTELWHTRRVGLVSASAEGLAVPSRELFGPVPGPDLPADAHDGLLLPPHKEPREDCAILGVSVTVADCMPIWLLDRSSGACGVLHSGWKGTGILAVAVDALRESYGTEASSIAAIFGPAIGVCCYEVPAERAKAFAAEFGAEAVRIAGGRSFLDLRAANLALARKLGLGSALFVEACTSCDRSYGSSRRETREAMGNPAAGEGQADFTRMLAFCGWPPAGAGR